jgi:photosystem II stability/assembly factor-like uncharacterized protein
MSELDKSLDELRDDLRSTITPPDLAQVVGRARQRSVRRRMQLGAIGAVVAVSVAVPVLRAVPEPPSTATPLDPPAYQVDFADADHGYALGNDCDGSCEITLLATEDGGRTWHPRQVPAGDEAYRKSELLVADADRLVLYLTPVDAEAEPTALFSVDSGQTWRESDGLGLVRPTFIPPGADLQGMCTATTDSRECTDSIVDLRPDGSAVWRIPTEPPLVPTNLGPVATASGEFWVIGRDASGQRAIAVTADDGRTWATNPLDVRGEPTRRDPWSVVGCGDTLYATVVGSVGNNPVELLAVFRSTDRGRSWTRTWQPTEGRRLLNVFGDAVATADGRLLVYSTTEGTLESTDGRTFTKVDRRLPGPVTWTRGGYVAEIGYVAEGRTGYEISQDGIEWWRFELP